MYKERISDKMIVGNIQIDQVRSFSYFGTTVNGNNSLEEEIRERIFKGNKAFCANRAIFKSKLVSRKSKLKLYWSVIRPVVVHGRETWVLKVLYRDSQCLRGKYLETFLDQLKKIMVTGESKQT